MTAWYVIRTNAKPQSERIAEEHLLRQGYEVYLPRTFADVRGNPSRAIEPLFPRYVFIQLSTQDNWAPIRSTRGVAYLLCFGEGESRRPAQVPPGVIDELISRETAEGVHGLVRDYQPGDRVRYRHWYDAVVEATSRHRVTILMEMLGAYRRVDVPRQFLEPAA